jgi:hypothetical protein
MAFGGLLAILRRFYLQHIGYDFIKGQRDMRNWLGVRHPTRGQFLIAHGAILLL